ncbi:hypothetical protein HDF22_002849 [Mucilaginibacter lappiensis]|uniref:Uncharacterized protein n=1 Tax=Mucilaginibacter lappiensis TaxID=354630 RepID=A0A841JGJ8_9SPHI|nr:hypothetical protein [Mucilaginibacter lappiensis]
MTIVKVKHFASEQIIYNISQYYNTGAFMQIYSYYGIIKTF